MIQYIDAYIQSKKHSWSDTTKKSERARLSSLKESINLDPTTLYESLVKLGKKPYSIKTTFLRLKSFYDYLIDTGARTAPNLYQTFINENRRVFKYAYDRKPVQMSFDEGVKRIKNISDNACRRKALEIIGSGLRLSEYRAVDRDNGRVRGKGGKLRKISIPEITGAEYLKSDTTFRRELARVGLRPHDLRKLFATRLLQEGVNIVDVARVLGHSSITTTEKYIQDSNSDSLHQQIQAGLKEVL